VYIHIGFIYTIMTYRKTSGSYVGGGRPIMRWMDAKTSTLVLLAMVFLDPLERYLLTSDGEAAVDQALLFRDVSGEEQPGRTLAAALHEGALRDASPMFLWSAGVSAVDGGGGEACDKSRRVAGEPRCPRWQRRWPRWRRDSCDCAGGDDGWRRRRLRARVGLAKWPLIVDGRVSLLRGPVLLHL